MKKSITQLKSVAEAFNNLYPVGTTLNLERDNGSVETKVLKSKAWVLGDHSVVAIFEGISGGYDISRVKHKLKYKHNDLGMKYLVPCDAQGNELNSIIK